MTDKEKATEAQPGNETHFGFQAKPDNHVEPDTKVHAGTQAQPDNQGQNDCQVQLDNQVQPDNPAQPNNQTPPDTQAQPGKQAQPDYSPPPGYGTEQSNTLPSSTNELLPLVEQPKRVTDVVVVGMVGTQGCPVLPPKPDPFPPPWTPFSIFNLIFICPIGFVALICSCLVHITHRKGKYAAARRISCIGMWLNGIGIVSIFILAIALSVTLPQ